ncbi:MAG: tRNA (adenosine(37)-N6)-dimethylallyltransferase MiaA [Candidatus Spechtbacterales bacterium]
MAKLIVIVGPTASGKSDLAVFLALRLSSVQARKKYGIEGAEIISADSRQVYKYMNIGTGKITKKEMKGIPHYMLDVAHPSRQFTVAQYKKSVEKIIRDIQKRGKVPILVGGTGFYIDSVVYDMDFPEVKANKKLRHKLEKLSAEELFEILKKKDAKRAKTIESKNKRRLIRALEIVEELGKVPENNYLTYFHGRGNMSDSNTLIIGIKVEKELLHKRIEKRLDARLNEGPSTGSGQDMIEEVRKLREEVGVSWKRLENFGLEYRWIAKFLQDKISKEEMQEELARDIKRYARRQMVWFKRNKDIKWIELESKKQSRPQSSRGSSIPNVLGLEEEAEKLINNFLY